MYIVLCQTRGHIIIILFCYVTFKYLIVSVGIDCISPKDNSIILYIYYIWYIGRRYIRCSILTSFGLRRIYTMYNTIVKLNELWGGDGISYTISLINLQTTVEMTMGVLDEKNPCMNHYVTSDAAVIIFFSKKKKTIPKNIK